jgi:hypothetical protein
MLRIESVEPKAANPRLLMLLPNLETLRVENDDPKVIWHITDRFDPNRVWDLIDRLDPIATWLQIDAERLMDERPRIEQPDPTLVKLLSEKVLPH